MKKRITGYDYHSVGIKNQNQSSLKEQKKTKYVFRIISLTGLMSLLAMVYIWSEVQIVEYGYEISNLEYEKRHLLMEQKKLEVELSTLNSAFFIDQIAKEKLNLKELNLKQINYITP